MHGAFFLLSCRKFTGAKCDSNMSREAVAKQSFKVFAIAIHIAIGVYSE